MIGKQIFRSNFQSTGNTTIRKHATHPECRCDKLALVFLTGHSDLPAPPSATGRITQHCSQDYSTLQELQRELSAGIAVPLGRGGDTTPQGRDMLPVLCVPRASGQRVLPTAG